MGTKHSLFRQILLIRLSSRLTLCEVDEGDFERVIAIRDITWDYLPGNFEIMLRTPDTKAFALEDNDELIAFLFITLLDDNTGILRSARVKNTFEGAGVFQLLYTMIIKHYMVYNNMRTIMTYTVSKSPREITRIQNGVARYVTMRRAVQFITQAPKITDPSDDIPILVEEINREGLDVIFKDKDLCKFLFPNGYFVALQMPFKLLNSNIKKILNYKSYLLKTGISENVGSTLLSYGVCLPCKEGYIIHLDLFGNLEIDIKEHIDVHLRRIINDIGQTSQILLIVNVDERQNISNLQHITRTFGFKMEAEKICIITEQNTRKILQ